MEHILDIAGRGLDTLRSEIFPSMAEGNAILFLGAGASVTDQNKFLSTEVIKLYSAKKRIELDTNDITEFVDILSADESFNRSDFDEFVAELLSRLKTTNSHRVIASVPWKEIITTNVDLLIEHAFDEVANTPEENLHLFPVHNIDTYRHNTANDEVKCVKLNGCICDKSRYQLVFSTQDFNDSNVFYKNVLKSLEDLSNKITFLSVGFSYSDPFAKSLMERFNKYNLRAKKWMLNVDPYAEDARLPYFSENKIRVIRSTSEDFFSLYDQWQKETHAHLVNRKQIRYANRENKLIPISDKIALRIGNDLQALSDGSKIPAIPADQFYRGEQPNYDVVRKDYDVIKRELLDVVKSQIRKVASEQHTVIPIVLLTGSYGTGKTTLSYRLIDELVHEDSLEAMAFEVFDTTKLKASDLGELFSKSGAKTIILFFNGIEVDSAFKGLDQMRTALSVEQFTAFNLILVASIRENILSKYKLNNHYANTVEINVDRGFETSEAMELIEKLRGAGLVKYRDARERNALASRVITDYAGDTLISLISLVSGSHHSDIIRQAYSQLSRKAQEAFLLTSLLYRFGILMPAGLLRPLISKTWDEFTRDVLEYDSKGILIQETKTGVGTEPDIYFRTRHPIISESLVQLYLPSEDRKFERYRQLVQNLNPSKHSATLVIDLLKALRRYNDLSREKISKLFDYCSQIFDVDPHFNLHYAIDLQNRHDEESLEKGIERIRYAESFLEYRSHRLIHRRAVLNFDLAKKVLEREKDPNETYRYINEAKSLFDVKLILDPFSSFSYVDYLKFEIWFLDTFVLDDTETLRQRVIIEELFDKAEKSVLDGAEQLTNLKAEYIRKFTGTGKKAQEEYLHFLDAMYEKPETRPFALVLKYYHFHCSESPETCPELVSELESFSYLDEVAKVLFRNYGRGLYIADNRVKFFSILKNHPELQEKDPVRYHYYSYVAEAYNRNFGYAYDHLGQLRKRVHHLNPDLSLAWKNPETNREEEFEGIVRVTGPRKRVRVIEFARNFDFKSGDYSAIRPDTNLNVNLHFFLTGIRASIVPRTEITES